MPIAHATPGETPDRCDVAILGGGPSGAVAARLLAAWGLDVCLMTRVPDPQRALANSLPPSTLKLIVRLGLRELVEQAATRTDGNTVWWGDREGAVEPFSTDGSAWGYQVDRAVLDPLLLDAASIAGVRVERQAQIRRVNLRSEGATVHFDADGRQQICVARMALDCSGRSGVIANPNRLRRHVRGGRMQALVGVWQRDGGWVLPNSSHTFIETCQEGWAWSLATSGAVRHVGIMVDGATSGLTRGRSLQDTYLRQLALTPQLERQVRAARLVRVFACDATVYSAHTYAGGAYILVGDAGSTLNPLSSFGVKKALTSAWLAAVVTNTCILHPDRAGAAREFFSRWEEQVWHLNLKRSREFAVEALRRHRSRFWEAQAESSVDPIRPAIDESEMLAASEVKRTLDQLRRADTVVFSRSPDRTLVSAPLVHGNLIAVEDAVALGPDARDAHRYVGGIDLVALIGIAPLQPDIPRIYEAYCTRNGVVPLPEFLACLALLVSRGVLRAHSAGAVAGTKAPA